MKPEGVENTISTHYVLFESERTLLKRGRSGWGKILVPGSLWKVEI